MYGCLRPFLGHLGYAVRDQEELGGAAELEGVDVLVLVMPTEPLPPATRDAILEFVRGGGALFAMGDHTDLFGSMGHFNELLGEVGIRFRFDSAIKGGEEWDSCLEAALHPIHASFAPPRGLDWGIGASLDVRYPARPILVGRRAYGDVGDYGKGEAGGNMGDMRYARGELLGCLLYTSPSPRD